MKMFTVKALIGAAALLPFLLDESNALKIGLLSDLHINLAYEMKINPGHDSSSDCIEGSGIPTEIKAPMGRYGCDPPVVMLEQMLTRMNEKFGH